MATLADLKTRIQTNLVRDDLADDLADELLSQIQDACEYYADEKFWFNSLVASISTVASTATVDMPVTFRRIDQLTIPAYNKELREETLENMPIYPVYGIPECYAYYNDQLTLHPIPNAVYTLEASGIKQIDAPALDADSNEWTNEAAPLIRSHTRFTLLRDQFRDAEGAQMASGAVAENHNKLRRKTAKRLETKLRPRVAKRPYNINYE